MKRPIMMLEVDDEHNGEVTLHLVDDPYNVNSKLRPMRSYCNVIEAMDHLIEILTQASMATKQVFVAEKSQLSH